MPFDPVERPPHVRGFLVYGARRRLDARGAVFAARDEIEMTTAGRG